MIRRLLTPSVFGGHQCGVRWCNHDLSVLFATTATCRSPRLHRGTFCTGRPWGRSCLSHRLEQFPVRVPETAHSELDNTLVDTRHTSVVGPTERLVPREKMAKLSCAIDFSTEEIRWPMAGAHQNRARQKLPETLETTSKGRFWSDRIPSTTCWTDPSNCPSSHDAMQPVCLHHCR